MVVLLDPNHRCPASLPEEHSLDRLYARKNRKVLTPRRCLNTRELCNKCSRLRHRTARHNFVTHISRHVHTQIDSTRMVPQGSGKQYIAECPQHEQKPNLSTLLQKNLFGLEITSAPNQGNHIPNAQAMQTLSRCGGGKNIHSTLVDLNDQVEQGEIQRQGEKHNIPRLHDRLRSGQ